MKPLLINNKNIFFLILFVLLFLIGCWEFLSIDQPEIADPNSFFEVPITVALTPADSSSRGYNTSEKRGYFGIRLPIGWTVKDSITYQGAINGTFIYSSAHSDSMEVHENSPAGYYWWVGVGDSLNSIPEGSISLIPYISTDDQTGLFLIDYMLSDRTGHFSDYIVHSGPFPISVGLPMTATVTNTNNDGSGSLRQALTDVSNGGEILFNLFYSDTIFLDSQLVVDRNITISGPDSGDLNILGTDSTRVFFVNKNLRVDISNLKISNGNDDSGGGIFCLGSNLSLRNTIINNNAAGDGGGIFFKSEDFWGQPKENQLPKYSGNEIGDNHTLNLTNVIISQNSAASGGGIHCPDGNLILKNVAIINNTAAEYGGGINNGIDEMILTNVTIVNNSASIEGGGIFGSDSPLIMVNTIIWDNEALVGAGFFFWNYNMIDIVYSDIQGGWPGNTNINANPMFVDTVNGDYRLQTGSPCIDAGTAFFELSGDTIINLNQWQYNGAAPDMGAYESGPLLGITEEPNNPKTYALNQNYPNPFNPSTTIEFTIAKSEFVTLKIYNLLGQEVTTLVSDKLTPGKYKYTWDASDFASGIYYYTMEAGSFTESKKLLLLK